MADFFESRHHRPRPTIIARDVKKSLILWQVLEAPRIRAIGMGRLYLTNIKSLTSPYKLDGIGPNLASFFMSVPDNSVQVQDLWMSRVGSRAKFGDGRSEPAS